MVKRGPKRDHDAEQRILDATRDLICARGASGITINEIIAKAGVGRQTIYRWWPSKAAVVYATLEREISTASPPPNTGTTFGDIQTQMQRVAKLMSSHMGAIVKELLAESFSNHEIAEQFRTQFFAGRREPAARTIREGIARGDLRPDLEIEVALDLLYSPLWLRMIIGHQPITPSAVDELLNQVWPALAAET
jgi:AcrR family transcriptional regulator